MKIPQIGVPTGGKTDFDGELFWKSGEVGLTRLRIKYSRGIGRFEGRRRDLSSPADRTTTRRDGMKDVEQRIRSRDELNFGRAG